MEEEVTTNVVNLHLSNGRKLSTELADYAQQATDAGLEEAGYQFDDYARHAAVLESAVGQLNEALSELNDHREIVDDELERLQEQHEAQAAKFAEREQQLAETAAVERAELLNKMRQSLQGLQGFAEGLQTGLTRRVEALADGRVQ